MVLFSFKFPFFSFPSNVETLVVCNAQLIKDLAEKRRVSSVKDPVVVMGEVFEKLTPYFKMYTFYCANYPKAMSKLEEYRKKQDFANTLRICETDPKAKGLTLASFLIKPVQRFV